MWKRFFRSVFFLIGRRDRGASFAILKKIFVAIFCTSFFTAKWKEPEKTWFSQKSSTLRGYIIPKSESCGFFDPHLMRSFSISFPTKKPIGKIFLERRDRPQNMRGSVYGPPVSRGLRISQNRYYFSCTPLKTDTYRFWFSIENS